MKLESLDWMFVIGFFVVALVIGLLVARRAGRSASEFFLSGRAMPWWLLGMSMVATTFSTDTAQPGDRLSPSKRSGGKLGLVGVSADRHADGLRLCQIMAAFGCDHGC